MAVANESVRSAHASQNCTNFLLLFAPQDHGMGVQGIEYEVHRVRSIDRCETKAIHVLLQSDNAGFVRLKPLFTDIGYR